MDGINVSKMEAISQRKLPGLSSIMVEFSDDHSELIVTGNDMPELGSIRLPCDAKAYDSQKKMRVECSGKSTTTGGGWSFGFIDGRSCGDAVDSWLTTYLNAPHPRSKQNGMLNSGKKKPSRYGLVRNMGKMELTLLSGTIRNSHTCIVSQHWEGPYVAIRTL